MKAKYIESFPTIDLCVNYLVSIGCKWNCEIEQKLIKQSCFKFNDIIVFYDPHELLELKG